MDVVLLLIRIFLFAVFAVAAIGKLLDLEGAEKSVKAFGTPPDLAKTFAILIPFAEMVFAVCLLFTGFSWLGAIGVFLLLTIFSGGMIAQMAQGKAPDCHCFGAIHSEPVSKKSLVRNIVFAVLAFVLIACGANNQGLSFTDLTNEMAIQLFLGLATLGMLGAVVFYLKKISEQQTQIMRRIEILELVSHEGGHEVKRDDAGDPHDSLPLGAIAPDFELPDLTGKMVTFEHLLAKVKPLLFFFVSPNCHPCEALLPEIEKWQDELKDKVEFVFISSGGAKENAEKFGTNKFKQILLQKEKEVSELFHAKWTPTAVFVNSDGIIASHLSVGDEGIRSLVHKIKHENLDNEDVFIADSTKVKIGEEVPQFSMQDIEGRKVSSEDFKGKKTLVAFWSTTCPHCLNMIEELKEWDKQKGADEPNLIVFSEGEPQAHREIGLQSPIVLDEGYKTSEKFGMFGTPSAVLVNERGKIVSETATGAANIWALIGKRK